MSANVVRQLPKWNDVAPLIGMRMPTTDRAASLDRAADIHDLRRLARRRTPRAVFDYTDGAAGTEASLTRARDAWARVEFRPRVLRDVSTVDTSTSILGQISQLPIILAPTGFTRMMGYEGEPAVARAAADAGLPYALSTVGTTSIEELAAAVPDVRRWFQLYIMRDRSQATDLLDRARRHGYDTLVVTVDTPVAGPRLRDVRNGLTIPPHLELRTLLNMARYPRWWGNILTTPPLEFATLRSTGGTVADLINRAFDPSVTLEDLVWTRDNWPGTLVVKGIQSVEDALAVTDLGADALVLSNHGGRQLDRAPIPLELLPTVRSVLGDRAEIFVDGGIMSGADAVAAVAMGARAVLVGRAYLYGLMACGEQGVRRALDILRTETRTTMQLLGVTSIDGLTADHARLRDYAM